MTTDEFLSYIKSRGAHLTDAVSLHQIALTNTTLQHRRHAMLPAFMSNLYTKTGGIILGNGCIFGPNELPQGLRYPIPTIVQINQDALINSKILGKTVFGRNDLFWFTFDAFGTCFMLDNLTLSPLRKYEDPYRALIDCLIAGKI
ncbi:MAG: hypothetical protein R8M70_04805 [Alphaproteobacteria bacterium]|nr:hypothetical protein [Alphaproteobacteria bacterium]